MEPPRRSWLPVPSNCPVSLRPLLHTASRSLSLHCALAIQVSPPPRSVGCGCRSLQGGSLLLIIDAKLIQVRFSLYPSLKKTYRKQVNGFLDIL